MTISQVKKLAIQVFGESTITQDPTQLFDLYGNAIMCASMLEDYFFIDFKDYGYVLVNDSHDDDGNPCISVSLYNIFRGLPYNRNPLQIIYINRCINSILENNSFEIAGLNNISKIITEPYFAEIGNKLPAATLALQTLHSKLVTLFSADCEAEPDKYYCILHNPQSIGSSKSTELFDCIKNYYDSLRQLIPYTFKEHCIKACSENPTTFKKI